MSDTGFWPLFWLTVPSCSLAIAAWTLAWVKRSWPPWATKQISLMGAQIIFGSIWVWFPLLKIAPVRPWSNCEIEEVLSSYFGAAVWVPALTIRFLTLESIFVHHNADLPNPLWRLFKMWLWAPMGRHLLTIKGFFVGYAWAEYDEAAGVCPEGPTPFPPDGSGWEWLQIVWVLQPRVIRLGPYLVLYFLMIRAVWRLKNVRAQFNEFRETAPSLALSFGAFMPVALGLSTQTTVVIYWLTVQVMFWSIMGAPLYHMIRGDKQYLHKFTYGFDVMPSASALKASLENKLAVPEIRAKFREFAGKRFAVENLDFYEACICRDQLTDYFERQAQTMKIIDTYIVPGSEKEVNLPHTMREEIYAGNVNDLQLFEASKREIMRLMTTNLGAEFMASKEMAGFADSANDMELLHKAGLTRGATKSSNLGSPMSRIGSVMIGRVRSGNLSSNGSGSGDGDLSREVSVSGIVSAPGQVPDEETSRANKAALAGKKGPKSK